MVLLRGLREYRGNLDTQGGPGGRAHARARWSTTQLEWKLARCDDSGRGGRVPGSRSVIATRAGGSLFVTVLGPCRGLKPSGTGDQITGGGLWSRSLRL